MPDIDVPVDTDHEIVKEALQLLEEPKKKRNAGTGKKSSVEDASKNSSVEDASKNSSVEDASKNSTVEDATKNASLDDDTLPEDTPKRTTRSTKAASHSNERDTKASSHSNEYDQTFEEPPEVNNSFEAPKTKRKRGRPRKGDTSQDSVIITRARTVKMKQHDFTTGTWLKERNILVLPEKQRPNPDVINVMTPIHHDYSHWKEIEMDIKSCLKDFDRMLVCAQCHMAGLAESEKLDTFFNNHLTWDKQDTLAHSLFPRDGPYDRLHAFEVSTRAVGDCLLDAMSRLTFGNQNHARELRTRMTLEGIVHADWYLAHENLAINLPLLTTEHSLPERYALYSGTKSEDYSNVYREEIKRCFKDGEYCGLWQIHQMATVIGRPITSVFPEFDDVEDEAPLRYYHNRIIYPRIEEDRLNESAVIMWTKSSPFADDLANHIVPVVM